MANESRGILYETIADAALRQAVELAGTAGIVRWNEKPANMSIVPDFTIGLTKDEPSHVVLVTASGSAKETDKKFWRNVGELQEVNAQVSSAPAVLNLYFKSVVKQGLATVSESLYDATLHVDYQSYYAPLEAWVRENVDSDAKTREAKQEILASDMAADPVLAGAVASLAQDLTEALRQRKTELDPLWALMRVDYAKPHHPPKAKKTTVRRGLGKLLVLEPELRQLVYAGYGKPEGVRSDNVPQYAWDLGFFKRSLVGAKIADPEILGALELLGTETCEAVLQKTPKSMSTWINPLRDLGRVDTHVEFVQSHYDEVTNPASLEQLLLECFHDPAGLSSESGDEKVWVYEIIVSLLKAKSGRLQGYGLAQLAVDTGLSEVGEGAPLARFIIPKFVQREELLKPEYLRMLATGLASRFTQNISYSDIDKLREKVEQWVIKENLEDRLIPYRNFEPLLWLLEAELERQGKAYVPKTAYTGWVNEYAGTGRSSATTPFVKVGTTLIHWKSVSDAGKVHKKKELAARARSVKYQYHTTTNTFTPRMGTTQLALIIDGTFTDDDLRVLSESGWDVIIYPDEIASLVQQLP